MPWSAKEKAEIGLSVPCWVLWRQFWVLWTQLFLSMNGERIQDHAHTMGGLCSVILRTALAIIIRIRSKTAIYFLFSCIKVVGGGGGGSGSEGVGFYDHVNSGFETSVFMTLSLSTQKVQLRKYNSECWFCTDAQICFVKPTIHLNNAFSRFTRQPQTKKEKITDRTERSPGL